MASEDAIYFETIYLIYHDEITVEKAKSLMEVCTKLLTEIHTDCFYFLFSSGGGQVDSAITLYNFLKGLPVKIVMHNIGSIDSAANVVFMAGDERYAAPNTSFLFHGVAYGFAGSVSLGQIQEGLSIVQEAENKIASILASNSSITETEVRKLFSAGESKPASYAKEKGVVSDLIDLVIPSGAPVYTININVNG